MALTPKLIIPIDADIKKASTNLSRVSGDVKKKSGVMGNAIKKLKSNYLAAGAAIAGLTILIKKSLTLFGVQEKAQKTLAAAMKQAGTFTEEAFKHNLEYASSLQKMTTFGDEAILGVQKLLTNFGVEGEMLDRLTKSTLDLAAAKGMDLTAAADLVSKSVGSSTNALSRYGIQVTGAVGSTERMQEAVDNIAKLFGGAAAAEADTFAGRVEQLKNRLGDIGETIGKRIVPIVEKIISLFSKMSESSQTLTVIMIALTPVVIGLYVALGPLGIAMAAIGVIAIGVASDIGELNKELIVTNDMRVKLDKTIDESIIKSGEEGAANKKRIKENEKLIEQKKREIEQAREFIGVTNLVTGQKATQAKFDQFEIATKKEIADLENEITNLRKGGNVVSAKKIVLTKEETEIVKKLARTEKNNNENKIIALENLLKKDVLDLNQKKLIQKEIKKLNQLILKEKDAIDKANEAIKEKQFAYDEALERGILFEKTFTDLTKAEINKRVSAWQKEKEERIRIFEETSALVQSGFDIASSIFENYMQNRFDRTNEFNNQLAVLDEQDRQREKDKLAEEIVNLKLSGTAADLELADEKQRQLDRMDIEEKAAERDKEIKRDEAKANRKMSIAERIGSQLSIIAQTAIAVGKATAMSIATFGQPWAGFAIASGIAQSAALWAAPLPPIPALAEGGNFTTKGPMLAMLGDNPGGRENVNVQPLQSFETNDNRQTNESSLTIEKVEVVSNDPADMFNKIYDYADNMGMRLVRRGG